MGNFKIAQSCFIPSTRLVLLAVNLNSFVNTQMRVEILSVDKISSRTSVFAYKKLRLLNVTPFP